MNFNVFLLGPRSTNPHFHPSEISMVSDSTIVWLQCGFHGAPFSGDSSTSEVEQGEEEAMEEAGRGPCAQIEPNGQQVGLILATF